jgi:hypothetical protein
MRTVLVDDALPRALFERLAARFLAGNVEPFFRRSLWFSLDARPRLAVEQAVVRLSRFLPGEVTVAGGEWFVRSGKTSKGMAWHCDLDGGSHADGRHRHPRLSSLLYLSEVGGPTLVVDQTVCSPSGMSLPQSPPGGVAFLPAPNRFGVFPGDRLHAVGAVDDDDRARVTLGINWWPERAHAVHAIEPPYESPDFDELRTVEDLDQPDGARPSEPLPLDAARLAALPHRGLFPVWRAS